MVSELLEASANATAKDVDGDRPLQVAVMYPHVDCVRLLLPHVPASHLQERNKDGDSVTSLAANSGQSSEVTSLLMATISSRSFLDDFASA